MEQAGSPSTFQAALFGRCPRCGKGPLFKGLLTLQHNCSACGLDYSVFDPGDGPAVFGILIVGAIVAAGALWVEFTFSPPLWVHALLWTPAISILSTGFLRLAKSVLVVLQFKHKAQEGRRAE